MPHQLIERTRFRRPYAVLLGEGYEAPLELALAAFEGLSLAAFTILSLDGGNAYGVRQLSFPLAPSYMQTFCP